MICDTLEHLNRYRGFHENLDTAIDYLTAYCVGHTLADLPLGRTEVDGENVFINVMGLRHGSRRGSRDVHGGHRVPEQPGRRHGFAGGGAVRPFLPRRAAQARRGPPGVHESAQSRR